MDPYSEDLHLPNKRYVTDLSTDELSSLEQDREEVQPHFGVDEPLDVQLRFELGSLADTHVLIDTDGPRESHWDFVRQEQGRFQASEANSALLSHGKQDDLKSFENCGWSGSASQADTQLFIDGQDDVSMITEAFRGKDKSITHRQREEETLWIEEDKEALETMDHNSCREDAVNGALEDSQIALKELEAGLAGERSAEYRESHQTQVDEDKENDEAPHPAADVVNEPLVSMEQSCEAEAASPTACNPERFDLAVASEEAKKTQEFHPECSKRDLVESIQPELSNMVDVENSGRIESINPTKEVNKEVNVAADNAQAFEGKLDTVGSKVNTESKVDDRSLPTISDIVEKVNSDPMLQETQKLNTEPVIQTSDLQVDTCVMSDTGKSINTPEGCCLNNTVEGSRLESGSVLADPVEKQNILDKQCTGGNLNRQVSKEMGTKSNFVLKSFQEATVLSVLETSTTVENVVESHRELQKLDEGKDVTIEILNLEGKPGLTHETADNSLSTVVVAAVPAEVDGVCIMPATHVCEKGASAQVGMENSSPVNSLEQAEAMQGISTAADVHVARTLSQEDVSGGQMPAMGTCQTSGGHGDLEAADNNGDPHKHAVEGILDPNYSGESNHTLFNVDSPSKMFFEKQIEEQGASDCLKQENPANDANESILEDQMLKQHTAEENMKDSSFSSEKGSSNDESKVSAEGSHQGGISHVLNANESKLEEHMLKQHTAEENLEDSSEKRSPNESKVSAEGSHQGGILHVLLDVHKEGVADESLPKNAPGEDHLKMIEGKGLADAQTFNTSDITGGTKDAEGRLDTCVSGSAGQVDKSGSQEDPYPSQEKSGKRKADSSTRNNRLKESARATPLKVWSDQEQKNAVPDGPGRRKATPKSVAQKKGTEAMEGFASPKKSSSKNTSGRKKVLLPVVQDAEGSAVVNEGTKTAFSVNARHQSSPDLNGLETSVPMVSSSQPFSEPQQVQLRAQILVYGSLIQGVAPEEALMVAAFSNVTGGGRDAEASERAVWEKQWQAAIDRIHANKNSRDVLKDSSRANIVLVSNSPMTTPKAVEGGLKPNSSSGVANSMIDGRGVTGMPVRASEVSGTKAQTSRSKPTDSAHDISVSRGNQVIVAAAPAGSLTSTASRAVSSSLNESFIQPAKLRADSQQIIPQAYFPTPPLGPFIGGAPQWFSTAAFPGSWMPQSQAPVYSKPPSSFTHGHAAIISETTPETRISPSSSSGTVMPASSFGATLFTPVVAVTPTPIVDPLLNKQPTSESRPRKRKKTHTDSYGPFADVNPPFYLTGTAPGVGTPATLTASHMQTGQACLGISSSGYSPLLPPSARDALALVSTKTQLPNSSQEMPLVAVYANKVAAPSSTNMGSAGLPSVDNILGKSVNLQNSTNHLTQAQASAEEAASIAASALKESEFLWSELRAQKIAGSISDIDMQSVSSAIAVATAASVAKAAAAAAKAAYQAAVQAKNISEGVLEVRKQANESVASRLLGDKADSTSQIWGMPDTCNSILAAAKMASKQRLEALSAARVRAENFESVVRAAELTSNAITQVGSVMAMGESVPFTLDMLLEAGPDGLHTLEENLKTKPKVTSLRSPHRTGKPKSIEREKKSPLKITSGKEFASQRDAQLAVRLEDDVRINAELGVGLLTDLSKQKATDHLAMSMPACRPGSLTTISEGGLLEKEVLVPDTKIEKGSLVEVTSDEKGLCGVWFSARVQNVDGEKVFVVYDDVLADDGYSPLEEWIQLKGSSGKAPRVRVAHPNTNIGSEGTRKRRREAVGIHKWSVGDRVDAWIRDGWWEGEIKEIIEDGVSKAKVFFPGDGDTSIVKMSKLRPSLVWSNGHWVLWTDAKLVNKKSSRARSDTHEGDTPVAKRQKTEKAQTGVSMRQKLVSGTAAEPATSHKEAGSSIANMSSDFKADGIAKPRQQGPKVVFGVPRPTKKRKLNEVSKHFGSAKGVAGSSPFHAKTANNKAGGALVYAPGSSDTNRLDALKAKKRVLYHPRPQKDPNLDVKASGIRSKKEKTIAATKTLEQKNTLNKEGLPSASKNNAGTVMRKKNLRSGANQLESQEQSEHRSLPSNASNFERHTPSNAGEDVGKETPLTTQSKEKPNNGVKNRGRELSQAAEEIEGKEKQSSVQVKDSEVQSSAPASGNESASQSSKKKETQPSKDHEEVAHKGSEPQSNHEGEKKLEVSSKKQPANSVSNGEKQLPHSIKEPEKSIEVGKPASEIWEPRRTSRKIQPTSKLLEGLQTAPKLGKNSSLHDRGNKKGPPPLP